MKKLLLFLAFCSVTIAQAQFTAIPDAVFEQALIDLKYDDIKDGKVLTSNINKVKELDFDILNYRSIKSLKGIEDFVSLEILNCSYNYGISELDLTKNINLKELYCSDNNLTHLDVSKNIALVTLDCSYNKLSSLDVTLNTALVQLYCNDNQLTNLELVKNTNTTLIKIQCGFNELAILDVSNFVALGILYCYENKLTVLDVVGCSALTLLSCEGNQITHLYAKNGNQNFTLDNSSDNGFSGNDLPSFNPYILICVDSFNLSKVKAYYPADPSQYFQHYAIVSNCSSPQFTEIPDVNFEKELILKGLDDFQDGKVRTNKIKTVTTLNVSGKLISDLKGIQDFTALTYLNCTQNKLTNLDVVGCIALTQLECEGNQIQNLYAKNGNVNFTLVNNSNLSLNPYLLVCLDEFNVSKIKQYITSPASNLSVTSDCFSPLQYTLIPDKGLEYYLFDSNYDDIIDGKALTANIAKVQSLQFDPLDYDNCSPEEVDCYFPYNFTGMQDFKELKIIELRNFTASNFDVSKNLNLEYLLCSQDNLNLTNNTALTTLICDNCNFTGSNSLDLSKNVALTKLGFTNSNLTSLDINKNLALSDLDCSNNKLTNLDVSKNKALIILNCANNQLTSLDVSEFPSLKNLNCEGNQIEYLFAKNGNNKFLLDNNLYYSKVKINPYKFICVDDFNISKISKYIETESPGSKITINSYCSFEPGGVFYTASGKAILDNNQNGCDDSDSKYPLLKFSVSDGTNSGFLIANTTGQYSLPLSQGSHTLTPVLEHTGYFTVSPSSFTANFPTENSPLVQDFCITPNGIHHDLEVVLMPKGNAVPGFEANYSFVIKNKGNQTESGKITLAFDESLMDFVSASITPLKSESGLLTFEYSALQPFEGKIVDLVFKMNKPTDTPALNGSDVLTFVATNTGNSTEETPFDNVSTLRQTVLNSFDPNDKTCLEGNIVTLDLVGQYVHYVVRFENTGTLEARNIVVKDMIDTTKFDVNSLIVTNSSHSCVTKISETNKVEFIFENINLPFDDATNDGYIAFKIKTLPSLKVGDTFSNTADIFFDYNFPITTNEAKTTVQTTLNSSDFAFENYFSLYPNPAKNSVSLNSKNNIEVKNINVFNTLGQLVLSIPNAQTVSNFDVSRLNIGTYFVKIVTNKGNSTTKFIKE